MSELSEAITSLFNTLVPLLIYIIMLSVLLKAITKIMGTVEKAFR